MEKRDLQFLEIGLELLKREKPLDGACDKLLEAVQSVVRFEMLRQSQTEMGTAIPLAETPKVSP